VLLPYIRNPEQHSDSVFYYDDEFVVIWDKYPKAKHHLLVIPRKVIGGPQDLTKDDLPMLERMGARANWVVSKLSKGQTLKFQIGFHAIPSLRFVG
jgi:aprataxin